MRRIRCVENKPTATTNTRNTGQEHGTSYRQQFEALDVAQPVLGIFNLQCIAVPAAAAVCALELQPPLRVTVAVAVAGKLMPLPPLGLEGVMAQRDERLLCYGYTGLELEDPLQQLRLEAVTKNQGLH